MSVTFTNQLQVPSELTALPNRFTRPSFGSLYGFDAVPVEAPSISISNYESGIDVGGGTLGYRWTFTWPAVSGATSYEYRQTPMATPANIGNVTSRAFLASPGNNSNSPLYFQTRAVNTAGESEWSNAVPNIYLDLPTLTIGTPAGATLPLTWTNLRVGEDISYELQYATDAGFTTGTGSATIAADTTSYNFTMTTPGTTYYFKLRGKWTSSGPPSTVAEGIYSATVSHLYPVSGFNIDVRDTEANILARTGDATGVIAYGTDTEDLYVYDGTNWQIYNNS